MLTVYFSLNIFIILYNGYSFFYDLTSRTNNNDSFFNLFNFFWTSFTYLPIFYFINFFLFFYFYSNILLSILYIFLLYSFEGCDFLILNLNCDILNLNTTDVNLLLSNNLNKYHPYIFYLSSIFFFINTLLILHSYFIKKKSFFMNTVLLNSKRYVFNSLFINTIALFLGSYWALQEGTWGGWWDWDPSEVFGLLFFITLLISSHSLIVNVNFFKTIVKLLLSTIVILLTYFLIQLNFDLVSHNFGTKFFYFFNNNLFLLEFIIIFIFFYILLNYYLIYIVNNVSLIQYTTTYNLVGYTTNFSLSFIYLLILMLLLFSFIPLFNYFLWYDITTNYYDLVVYFNIIIISFVLVILGLFRLRKILDYSIILIFTTTKYTIPFSFIYFFKWSYSYTNLIHNLIVTFTVVNLSTHFIDITFFGLNNEFNSIFYNLIILNNPNTYFNCDNFFIDILNVYTDINNKFFFDWNIFYTANSPNNNPSLLLFNDNSFFNLYTILSNWLLSYSFIDLNYLSILYNFFIYTLLSTFLIYKTQLIEKIYY